MMLLKFKCSSTTVLAFLVVQCYVLSINARLNIERGERDVFDNPKCDSPTGVGCNCDGLNATCVNSTCKKCICSSNHGTFLHSNDTNGRCVKNRHLLFILDSSNSFLVQQTECMKPLLYSNVYFMTKTACDETDPTQRWIWTQKNQLMNIVLSKCLEQGERILYNMRSWYSIRLERCDSTKAKQLWSCQGQTFSLKSPKLYMNNRKHRTLVLGTSDFNERDLWTRYPSHENVCAKESCIMKTTTGECCVFPFRYRGKRYYGCTTIYNDNTPWCATTNNYVIADKWGNCSAASYSSFLVQNIKCMIPYNGYIKEQTCNVNDSSQHWIWTPNNQLMHADTLKCLQQGLQSTTANFWTLVLEECNSTETKQLWKCQGRKGQTFSLKNNGTINLYIGYRAWGTTLRKQAWGRYSSGKYLCSKEYSCYEFVNPLSAVLLTAIRKCPRQCLEEREISLLHKSGEGLCYVMWEKLQYLDNDQWKQLPFREEIFIVDKRNTRTFLQLNFTKSTNNWIGLIVKLYFYCAEKKLASVNITDIKCVVVKFKEFVNYTTTVPPTSTVVPTFHSTSTGKVSNSTSTPEKRKNDSSNAVTIIVVCVVIAILILCVILGFIFYKRKRCSAESKEVDTPVAQSSGNAMNLIYSSADDNPASDLSGGEATYQEPQSGASQECELYEPGDVHVYQYTNVKENGNQLPLQDNEYDVVNRGKESSQSTGEDEKGQSQSPVYQTLDADPDYVSLKV